MPIWRNPKCSLARYLRRYTHSAANTEIRVRFAPSPTGYLHLGGFRTALFNHLFAKNNKGKLILRIEDTDQSRYVEDAQETILKNLGWAGIKFDEGPHIGGPYGPYIQSERLHIYDRYKNQLLDTEYAYPCFCSSERLAKVRTGFRAENSYQTYDRHCLSLPIEEGRQRIAEGQAHVIRFKNDLQSKVTSYPDLVYGEISSQSKTSEDFILVKSDGYPTYHFANVIDDHLMKISHVLRGEEWIPSTPKHLALYKALDWTPPHFAHMPILVGPEGKKLSKRDGDVRLDEYIRNGWEPEALINFVALLGASWQSAQIDGRPIEKEVMTMPDLIGNFSLGNLNKHRSTTFPGKLAFLNRQHINLKTKSTTELATLAQRIIPELATLFENNKDTQDVDYVGKVILILQDHTDNILNLPKLRETAIFFQSPDLAQINLEAIRAQQAKKAHYFETTGAIVETTLSQMRGKSEQYITPEEVQRMFELCSKKLDIRGKALMSPLRLVITGQRSGPALVDIVSTLGKKRTIQRLQSAMKRLPSRINPRHLPAMEVL